MNSVSFTKEQRLKMFARVNEASVIKVFTFLNADGTPFPISAKGFKLAVMKTPKSDTNEFLLEEGDGFTVFGADNNKLQIEITEAKATLRPTTYFYRFYSEAEDHTWFADDFIFHEGKFDGVCPVDTNVTISACDVTIIVESASGSAGGGAIYWNFSANGNNFPTATDKGQIYISEDDHGVFGDADFVPANTWFASNIAGANEFDEFNYNI